LNRHDRDAGGAQRRPQTDEDQFVWQSLPLGLPSPPSDFPLTHTPRTRAVGSPPSAGAAPRDGDDATIDLSINGQIARIRKLFAARITPPGARRRP